MVVHFELRMVVARELFLVSMTNLKSLFVCECVIIYVVAVFFKSTISKRTAKHRIITLFENFILQQRIKPKQLMYNNQLRKLFAQGSFELKVLIPCYTFVFTVSLCEMGRFKSDRLKRDFFSLELNSMQ